MRGCSEGKGDLQYIKLIFDFFPLFSTLNVSAQVISALLPLANNTFIQLSCGIWRRVNTTAKEDKRFSYFFYQR